MTARCQEQGGVGYFWGTGLCVGYVGNGHMGSPVNGMIDTYENITLPQLRWWVVKMQSQNRLSRDTMHVSLIPANR